MIKSFKSSYTNTDGIERKETENYEYNLENNTGIFYKDNNGVVESGGITHKDFNNWLKEKDLFITPDMFELATTELMEDESYTLPLIEDLDNTTDLNTILLGKTLEELTYVSKQLMIENDIIKKPQLIENIKAEISTYF